MTTGQIAEKDIREYLRSLPKEQRKTFIMFDTKKNKGFKAIVKWYLKQQELISINA